MNALLREMQLMMARGAPVASDVSLVGPCAPTYGAIGSIALPAGCAAGDVLLVAAFQSTVNTVTPPSGSTTILARDASISARCLSAYAYVLTSADVSSGTAPFSVSGNSCNAAVFRGVGISSIVEVLGSVNVLSGNRPALMTATSITTTTSGDMLVFLGAVASSGGKLGTCTAPSGYIDIGDNVTNSNYVLQMSCKQQAAAGPTGSATASFDNANYGTTAAVLIALKAG